MKCIKFVVCGLLMLVSISALTSVCNEHQREVLRKEGCTKFYLAGPLFNEAERTWLSSLRDTLEAIPGVQIVWPFEQFAPGEIVAIPNDGNTREKFIYQRCIDTLVACDAVIAWLDGAHPDDGTAFEMGYANAVGKPLLGLRTDWRKAGEAICPSNVNAMLSGCSIMCDSVDALVKVIQNFVLSN